MTADNLVSITGNINKGFQERKHDNYFFEDKID